jgi:hypothetical protein
VTPRREPGLRDWMEQTHSSRRELFRHFLLRFFDSEFVSSPGQLRVLLGSAFGILFSLVLVFSQAYYHKYLVLKSLGDPTPYRLSMLADILFLIILTMLIVGLFTVLQWPSLFPGLRDYLALGGLPLRMGDVFVAKFTSLLLFAAVTTVVTAALPSMVLPFVMARPEGPGMASQIPAIFISACSAGLFAFFLLVAIQGVLLNLLPVRQFARFSLALQGILLTFFLCGFPFVISIPDLYHSMVLRPDWAVWVPPLWFLGLDQVMVGNRDPFALRLALCGAAGIVGAASAAVLAYLWSYKSHRVRVIETSVSENRTGGLWPAAITAHLLPNTRTLGAFSFVAKTVARSRQHRLILTAFVAIALAIIAESFVGLALNGGLRSSLQRPALRLAVIAVPLALSLFTLSGFRYLFRLPVELRANWIFRIHEPGHGPELVAGTERFLYYCAVAPVALLTLPVEMYVLGPGGGLLASALCLLPSLCLVELLLLPCDGIPFTSSYLPGRRPLIETVLGYSVAVTLYVSILSTVVNWCMHSATAAAVFSIVMLIAWWKGHKVRLDLQRLVRLEFEELLDPTVQTLGIERD